MTDARLKRLNGAIERAMRLARAECSSNRLQNCLSAAIVIVRRKSNPRESRKSNQDNKRNQVKNN